MIDQKSVPANVVIDIDELASHRLQRRYEYLPELTNGSLFKFKALME